MMGDSAGRSQSHPKGDGARRRNTYRERELIDPPFDERDRQIQGLEKEVRTLRLFLVLMAILLVVGSLLWAWTRL